jgi:predicted nucleotidyltransferase
LATGKPRKESDIDLMVIKKTSKKFFARMDEIGVAINKAGIETAKDVIVFTPEEIKKKLFMNDFFIKDIINNGILLYAK